MTTKWVLEATASGVVTSTNGEPVPEQPEADSAEEPQPEEAPE